MALHFELVTPAKLVRSDDVHMVVVPGTDGEFGVLEGHAQALLPAVGLEDLVAVGAQEVAREAQGHRVVVHDQELKPALSH